MIAHHWQAISSLQLPVTLQHLRVVLHSRKYWQLVLGHFCSFRCHINRWIKFNWCKSGAHFKSISKEKWKHVIDECSRLRGPTHGIRSKSVANCVPLLTITIINPSSVTYIEEDYLQVQFLRNVFISPSSSLREVVWFTCRCLDCVFIMWISLSHWLWWYACVDWIHPGNRLSLTEWKKFTRIIMKCSKARWDEKDTLGPHAAASWFVKGASAVLNLKILCRSRW